MRYSCDLNQLIAESTYSTFNTNTRKLQNGNFNFTLKKIENPSQDEDGDIVTLHVADDKDDVGNVPVNNFQR